MNWLKSKLVWSLLVVVVIALFVANNVYRFRTPEGGGETDFSPPRRTNPADVLVPDGYRVELVASDFTFPGLFPKRTAQQLSSPHAN
jgi:hypothetical protein